MNYYNEIKNELIDNEIYKKIKDYSKNRYELKVIKLRKEHIGQIEIYMNYIDANVKSINHDKTIGIIIAKYNNEFVMRYCSDPRIYNTTYELV